jgi:S1-C subfamily serine protease
MSRYDYYSRPQRGSSAAIAWPLILLGLLALFLVWRFWPGRGSDLNPNATERPVTPAGSLAEEEKSVIALYKSAAPSVVNVTSLRLARDRFNFNLQQIPKGMGTGFIWDTDGHIVTNYHVIEGADVFQVTLADHSTWRGRRVGGDPNMDLAVLRIDAGKSRLKPITVGDSHSLQVGQWAFAIGNPFGLDQSLAPGYISALGREIESVGRRPIKGVIQTTAPINPGNSGGPLLDSSGRLIGVNTAILSETGTWAGIGFAIPVDDVNRVVTQLLRHGKVARPGLGVVWAPDQLARSLGVRSGLLILNVYPDSSAAKAGLRGTRRTADGIIPGDVVLKLDGESVHNTKELYARLQNYKIGQEVTLTAARYDLDEERWQTSTVKVTLQEAES